VIYEESAKVNAILIYVEGERLYSGGLKSNGSSSKFFRFASDAISDDTWYHVAFVVGTKGGTTTFFWYLDGVLQDSQTAFTIPKYTGDVNLGKNGGNMRYPNCGTWSASSQTGSSSEHYTNSMSSGSSTAYYFYGNIWGFRIWNSARTSTQINDNMDSELSPGTNLVAYLDDTLENIQTDLRQSDYTFSLSSPTEDNNRFILRYNYSEVLGIEDVTLESGNLKSFFESNTLVSIAESSDLPTRIDLYDITGKKIITSPY